MSVSKIQKPNDIPIENYRELAAAISYNAFRDLVAGYQRKKWDGTKFSLIHDSIMFFRGKSFSIYYPNIDPDQVIAAAQFKAFGYVLGCDCIL